MDKRLAKRLTQFREDIKTKQTVVIRQIAPHHTEQMAYYRLLSNEDVTENYLIGGIQKACTKETLNKHVLVLSDTTDMDYSSQKKRIKPNTGLGFIGDGNGFGYNCHASLVIDAESAAIYGLSDIFLWDRLQKKSDYRKLFDAQKRLNKLKKKREEGQELSDVELEEINYLSDFFVEIDGVKYKNTYHLPLEYRESERWKRCAQQSTNVLSNAARITCIQDREGDLYDTFATTDFSKTDLLIRSKNNRPILTKEGAKHHLYDYRHDLTELGQDTFLIRDRETGKARMATVSLKSAPVEILRGSLDAFYQKNYPKSIKLNVVYVEEIPASVPEGKTPILWVLLTTHSVNTLEDAIQISLWYSFRWLIEVFFLLLKTKGFKLESSELETGHSLRKMGLLTMEAAIQILQLKQARDGNETVEIDTVFTESEIACLETIAPEYEGNTEKQQNPFPKRTLPWAAWLIARMGGWTGYKNNRPPGVITLKNGLDRFKNIHFGFTLQLK